MNYKTITKITFALCAILQIHGAFCAAAEEVPADHPLVEYTSFDEENWATFIMHNNEGEIFRWEGQLDEFPLETVSFTINLQPNSEAYMEALPEDIRELVVIYQRAQLRTQLIESIQECSALPASLLWGALTVKWARGIDPRLEIPFKSLGGASLLGALVYLFSENNIHPVQLLYNLSKEKKWILGIMSGYFVG